MIASKTLCDECKNKKRDLPNGMCECAFAGDTDKVCWAAYDEVPWDACNCYEQKEVRNERA